MGGQTYVHPATPIDFSQKYVQEKRQTIGRLMRQPNLNTWSLASAPLWFIALSATALGGLAYFYTTTELTPGSKGRDFVVRRSAGVIGDDGFVDNIPTKGSAPRR